VVWTLAYKFSIQYLGSVPTFERAVLVVVESHPPISWRTTVFRNATSFIDWRLGSRPYGPDAPRP